MLEVLIDKDNGLPRGKTSVKIMSACPLIRGANDGPIADLRRPLSESQLRESAASKKKRKKEGVGTVSVTFRSLSAQIAFFCVKLFVAPLHFLYGSRRSTERWLQQQRRL